MPLPRRGAIREVLAAHHPREVPALPGRTNHRRAGVLVPLRWRADLECVLIERAGHLRDHAGEIGFPGGKPEDGDNGLAGTALREAREELGIDGAEVLGRLSSTPLYTSDFRLEPFVAAIGLEPLQPDPGEVASVVVVGIGALLSRPHLDAIPYTMGEETGLSPVFELDGRLLFGGTAHVFLELLLLLAPVVSQPVPPLKSGRYQWSDLNVR